MKKHLISQNEMRQERRFRGEGCKKRKSDDIYGWINSSYRYE